MFPPDRVNTDYLTERYCHGCQRWHRRLCFGMFDHSKRYCAWCRLMDRHGTPCC